MHYTARLGGALCRGITHFGTSLQRRFLTKQVCLHSLNSTMQHTATTESLTFHTKLGGVKRPGWTLRSCPPSPATPANPATPVQGQQLQPQSPSKGGSTLPWRWCPSFLHTLGGPETTSSHSSGPYIAAQTKPPELGRLASSGSLGPARCSSGTSRSSAQPAACCHLSRQPGHPSMKIF